MAYVARRKLRLSGRVYEANEPIPDDELPGSSKLGSLVRVGYLVQGPDTGQASAPPPSVDTHHAPEASPGTGVDLSGLKIQKLRAMAKEQGLSAGGGKKDLIERLEAAS